MVNSSNISQLEVWERKNVKLKIYIKAYLKRVLTLLSTNAATIIGDKNPIEFPIALTIPATVPE